MFVPIFILSSVEMAKYIGQNGLRPKSTAIQEQVSGNTAIPAIIAFLGVLALNGRFIFCVYIILLYTTV